MRRHSLALLIALVPGAYATTAPAATRPSPAGPVVYRPECFQLEEAERSMAYPSSAPSAQVATGRGYGSGGKNAPNPKPAKTASPAYAPPPPPPAPMEAGAAYDFAAVEAEAVQSTTPKRAEASDAAKPEEVANQLARDDRAGSLDWGATVYLSNDDSMSLASAQRVLYAVMNGVGFSPREIRPHELLNYFSFDAVEPSDAQLFDVLASAEQHGDTLSVALAVKGATPPSEPLDLTLVVDRSCSMEEEGRMDYTKQGLRRMEEQLRDGDRVDVVLFDDRVCTPLENFVVGRDDPGLLRRTIEQMRPRGATDLDLGLHEGYAVARRHEGAHGRNRRMMVITDAMLNTGDVDPNTVSEIGKAYEADGIRLTGVGVGRDFNDRVLDMLTEKGKGAYVYLGSEAVVDRVFGVGFGSLTQTIAHDVQFALELPDSLAMARFYGEEASTVAEEVQPIHYYAGTSQVFLQDLVVRDGRVQPRDPVRFTVRYRDARTGEPEVRVFETTVGAMLEADPHNVRKARALMSWTDVLYAQALGSDVCGSAARAYGDRAAKVANDAEIAFVTGLVRKRCPGFALPTVAPDPERVAYKVRVDSDIPIAEVGLACAGQRWSERLSGSDTIASFDAVPGTCTLTLLGTIEMATRVDVPATGGDARCLVRGGRLSCG